METSKCPLQPSNFSLGAISVTEFSSKKDKFCIDFIGKSLAYLLIITFLWALSTFCDRTGLKNKCTLVSHTDFTRSFI